MKEILTPADKFRNELITLSGISTITVCLTAAAVICGRSIGAGISETGGEYYGQLGGIVITALIFGFLYGSQAKRYKHIFYWLYFLSALAWLEAGIFIGNEFGFPDVTPELFWEWYGAGAFIIGWLIISRMNRDE
jgi:hypothetical protein